MSTRTSVVTIDSAKRHLRNLASIMNRKGTTGRNSAARTRAIENHLSCLQMFFHQADETAETERMYDRYVDLERRWLGI